MKIIIFYESRFGNGKLLSEGLKKILDEKGAQAEAHYYQCIEDYL